MELKEIAVIHTDFPEKFGIPRQSGLVGGLQGTIVFSPEYRNADAIRGLNDFSHLWLVWGFSKAKKDHWSATVRPPRLGGKVRMGIFATRSPFRPNPIGLSSVKLESVTMDEKLGPIITVSGIDMLDGSHLRHQALSAGYRQPPGSHRRFCFICKQRAVRSYFSRPSAAKDP